MAKRTARRKFSPKLFHNQDLAKWNFVIFLTLGFILLVIVLAAMKGVALDLRTKAGLACPVPVLPRAEDCAGGWTFKRGADTCLTFVCEAKSPKR